MDPSSDHPITRPPDDPGARDDHPLKELTRWQRFQIWLLGGLAAWVVRLIGVSLRWQVYGWEHWEAARASSGPIVHAFWHNEIFAATWFWRQRGVYVMSGYNFDARFTARVIEMHGYRIARGSASRGAARALVAMVKATQRGHDTAFTIDGPRGPRHVAKAGAVMVAKTTGAPLICFHVRPARAWVFSRSWDRTEIPRPFSRVALFVAPAVRVPRDADDTEQARKLAEMQAALDGLVRQGEQWQIVNSA
jgi:lysophospholipid acyltransferase (LPLAT)-like uncharacterized protein